jgi:hypothetical protein
MVVFIWPKMDNLYAPEAEKSAGRGIKSEHKLLPLRNKATGRTFLY